MVNAFHGTGLSKKKNIFVSWLRVVQLTNQNGPVAQKLCSEVKLNYTIDLFSFRRKPHELN